MHHTQALPTVIASLALAVALVSLLGSRSEPAVASTLVAQIEPAAALGGGFTYQGSLSRGGQPVDGADACDLRFSLWDAAGGGTQQGAVQSMNGVDFAQGLFTVTLNEGSQFGSAAFAGEARWLQVEAACPRGNAFTSLGRQAITSVPYATYSQSAGGLQGRPVSQIAPTSGQVLAWDGSAWTPASGYARTVLVSPRATPADSGAALLQAQAAITDASAERPYLLKIEPGIYDLGATALQMKPYVDIEGSGEGITRITGAAKERFDKSGTLRGADNAALRQLTVEATSGSRYATAIVAIGTSPRISTISVAASQIDGVVNPTSGGILSCVGVYNGAFAPLNGSCT